MATFDRMMDRSDPEVMRYYSKAAQPTKDPFPTKLKALCRSDTDHVNSFWVMMIEWHRKSFLCTVNEFEIHM